jgi:rod shape-determining protein MreC
VPLTWAAAIAVIVAGVAALGLLLSDRRETYKAEAYGAGRVVVDTVVAPAAGVLSTPAQWFGAAGSYIGDYVFAVRENRRLKEDNARLRQWRDAAIALEDINSRYRALLGVKIDPPIAMVTARVVLDARGPFANTRLANAGAEVGIRVGNPVMSEAGLVGRVVGTAPGISRIVLLTDVVSHTPVMVDRTNARAILSGDGGPNPTLDYLRGQEPVRNGDLILTSGDGGVMPRGLPVGTAVKGLDGRWRVRLSSDAAPIDLVRILLFKDFADLAAQQALVASKMPPLTDVPTPVSQAVVPRPATGPVITKPPLAATAGAKPVRPKPAQPKEGQIKAPSVPAAKPADAPAPVAAVPPG